MAAQEIIPAETLLSAYSQGVFPMGNEDGSVTWYSSRLRGIIPMHNFHVGKNLKRLIRKSDYVWTVDKDFEQVIRSCAERKVTWINESIIQSFLQLHTLGFAHSIEIYREGNLVGGQYGVALRGAFFGESMFRKEPGMDKLAMYHCHETLVMGGFILWDTQFFTPHLGTLGGSEISDKQYMELLSISQKRVARFEDFRNR